MQQWISPRLIARGSSMGPPRAPSQFSMNLQTSSRETKRGQRRVKSPTQRPTNRSLRDARHPAPKRRR
eukprot:2466696-Pyramimonas_sp.AAC.1